MSNEEGVGFVYFLYCPAINNEYQLVKIGQTKNNVEKRIKQLQTGNPFPIEIYAVVSSTTYKQVEKDLHAKYKRRRCHGEWFQLTLKEVQHEVDILQRSHGCRCITSRHQRSQLSLSLTTIISQMIVRSFQLIDEYFVTPPSLLHKRKRKTKAKAPASPAKNSVVGRRWSWWRFWSLASNRWKIIK